MELKVAVSTTMSMRRKGRVRCSRMLSCCRRVAEDLVSPLCYCIPTIYNVSYNGVSGGRGRICSIATSSPVSGRSWLWVRPEDSSVLVSLQTVSCDRNHNLLTFAYAC